MASLAVACGLLISPTAQAAVTGDLGAHDPSRIIKEGDRYYYFATGRNLVTKYSFDLRHWGNGPRVFSAPPSWAPASVPGFVGTLWAPDVVKADGQYRLYYSVSTFGSQESVIGLATATTLDFNDPDFGWTDRGPVIWSQPGDAYNAIDPSIFQDDDGTTWMTFGSYWNGIYAVQLDPTTGKRISRQSPTYRLADHGSIEASHLMKRGDWYYLFVNWGRCCAGVDSTYNIRVGRGASPTGPFFDRSGNNLINDGGTLLLRTEENEVGPGHFSLFSEDGVDYFSYHYYDADDGGARTFNMRRLLWTADGWPMAGDHLSLPAGFGGMSTASESPAIESNAIGEPLVVPEPGSLSIILVALAAACRSSAAVMQRRR